MDETSKAIGDLLLHAESFLITSHIDPDGDAIGCQLAIYSVLKRLGKRVKVVSEDSVPAAFAFIEGSGEILTEPVEPCEVAVVVDSGSLDRVGSAKDIVLKCSTVVNIDHHGSNDYFGHHNLVITDAGACGEILYELLTGLGITLTTGEAEALYVAILSDTGCFRFPTTKSGTLRAAASLLDIGVKPYHVASEIFWKRSPAALKLLSSALATIEITHNGSIASMEVTQRMYEATGGNSRDTEGFTNYPRSIRGVKVGILLREIGNGRFRVSLRSRSEHAIDGVAKSFGGGGHPTAAGFRIEGDLQEIKSDLRDHIYNTVLKHNTISKR